MKTGCLIYSDNLKYKKLHDCAVKSFSKFNPDVEVYSVDYQHEASLPNSNIPAGVFKYTLAAEIFDSYNLDKIIILGADTITCSRLDEFLDDNSNDILATLDYPYSLKVNNNQHLSNRENHINADVVCFNNVQALKDIINLWTNFKTSYYEQACLNYIVNVEKKYKSKIVDGDYDNSDVVYNARAKGNLTAEANCKPWPKYTNLFEVKNNKLFTGTHEYVSKTKQIKVWHYCDGLGTQSYENFSSIINSWIDNGFNNQTKSFFTNNCCCGDFFNKEFKI